MKILGMYGVPVIGEVGPDGTVTFDPAIQQKTPATKHSTVGNDGNLFRRCVRCKCRFRPKGKDDPMLICSKCVEEG